MAFFGFLVNCIQILAAIISLCVAVTGFIHIHASPSLAADWCSSDTDSGDCWTNNNNAPLALFFYGIAIALFGLCGFVGALKIRGWLAPLHRYKILGPYFMVIGSLTLGAAGNTGILFGSWILVLGFLITIFGYFAGVEEGPLSFHGLNAPGWMVFLLQWFAVLTTIGIFVAGIMCMVAVGKHSNKKPVEWCDGDKVCWQTVVNGEFALGAYGFALLIFSVVGVIAILKIRNWLEFLHPWVRLGPYLMFIGILTLGAAGNTGILFGAMTIAAGALMFLIFIFSDTDDGYSYSQVQY
eukprot:Colp12_sorted_trinity150504_noHs@24554